MPRLRALKRDRWRRSRDLRSWRGVGPGRAAGDSTRRVDDPSGTRRTTIAAAITDATTAIDPRTRGPLIDVGVAAADGGTDVLNQATAE